MNESTGLRIAAKADEIEGHGRLQSSLSALVSLAVHLLAFLLLAIWFVPTAARVDEPDRVVGIVVTPLRSKVEYYDSSSFAGPSDIRPATTGRTSPVSALPDSPLPGMDFSIAGALPDEGGSPGPSIAVDAASQLATATSRSGSGRAGSVAARIPSGPDDEKAIEAERERLRRPVPTGPVVPLSLFGSAAAEGRSFVFVLDRSKSMGAGGLDAIDASQKELRQALQRLQPDQRFQIIVYNFKTLFVEQRQLLPATDENKRKAEQFLAQFGGFGATEHEAAIHSALTLAPDVIFLLTDGGDPYLTDSQLTRIQQRAGGRTSIHCVQFGLGAEPGTSAFMRQLAGQNNGTYTYVDRSKP